MLTLPFLELMVIRGCNLSCQGCTTFSDLRHAGYMDWSKTRDHLLAWTQRLNIESVGVMGGEPLMHPDIVSWLLGVRELLPNSQIRFVTNGLLLHKHWHVFELLHRLGNTVFKISVHKDTPELQDSIQRIFEFCDWEPVEEHGIRRWKNTQSNTRFQLAQPKQFLKTFRNSYHDMEPHNSVPAEAFEICVQQRCPMLWQGRLFKCGTLALTPDMLSRQNWPNREQWKNFIDNGLGPDCSDKELGDFVNNFGKPHSLCRQCPSTKDISSMIDHTATVVFK